MLPEEQLAQSNKPDPVDYRSVLALIPDIIIVVDRDRVIRYINRVEPGYDAATVIGTDAAQYVDPALKNKFMAKLASLFERGEGFELDSRSPATDAGGERWYRTRYLPISKGGDTVAALMVAQDITAQRLAEAEAQKLGKLLPLCAWCKRVRNDQGYWDELEEYLSSSGTRITHGMCPDCFEKTSQAIPSPSRPRKHSR